MQLHARAHGVTPEGQPAAQGDSHPATGGDEASGTPTPAPSPPGRAGSEEGAGNPRAEATGPGPVTESAEPSAEEERRRSEALAGPAHAPAGSGASASGEGAEEEEGYEEKIDLKKLRALFVIPSNFFIFAQSIPGCIPWGAWLCASHPFSRRPLRPPSRTWCKMAFLKRGRPPPLLQA